MAGEHRGDPFASAAASTSAFHVSAGVPAPGGRELGDWDGTAVRTRSDSDDLVNEYAKIPMALRAQVEAWELNREEILIDALVAQEAAMGRASPEKRRKGPQLKTCKWRGLECVAKILNKNHDKSEFSDMMEELSYVSRLRHPNLVLFLGAVTTSSPLLILTEYLSLGSLDDFVERSKVQARNSGAKLPWSPDKKIVFRWCIDLAKALSFLHSCTTPVSHRSLYPSKCLLQEDLHLKVSDFGMSKTLQLDDPDGKPIIRSSARHCWQAPELLRGDSYFDHSVDLYSMGMIYWFIINGEKPFNNLPQNTVSHAVCQLNQRPATARVGEQYGSEMVTMMERLWDAEPALRIKAVEVVDELEEAQKTIASADPLGKKAPKGASSGLSSPKGGSPKPCVLQ